MVKELLTKYYDANEDHKIEVQSEMERGCKAGQLKKKTHKKYEKR